MIPYIYSTKDFHDHMTTFFLERVAPEVLKKLERSFLRKRLFRMMTENVLCILYLTIN